MLDSCRAPSRTKVLRVGFPLYLLRKDQKILDPSNTDSVYEFFLLQNLAAGLVRDSSESPSGYAPGLAESWLRLTPKRWVFTIKPGLAWSDGTAITPRLIASHLKSLSRGEHRHVIYLKKLLAARPDGQKVLLDFSASTNEGLIHELSLADTALTHPKNLNGDWRVVSGAFSVESYEPGKKLVLRKNHRYYGQSNYPESVELIPYTDDTIGRFFDSVDIDLLKLPVPTFRKGNQELLSRAPQVLRGYPIVMSYMFFNQRKPRWRDIEARRDFAVIMDQALAGFALSDLKLERQVIPTGFSGRLKNTPAFSAKPSGRLAGKRITINLWPPYEQAEPFREAIIAGFAKAEVPVDVRYAWQFKRSGETADAQMTIFAGNQADSMGTWQFLFSTDHGDLFPFRREVAPVLKRIMAAETKETRQKALEDLHRQVLQQVYLVPLFSEPDILIASDRVDISALNPFDVRLRFYDIHWK